MYYYKTGKLHIWESGFIDCCKKSLTNLGFAKLQIFQLRWVASVPIYTVLIFLFPPNNLYCAVHCNTETTYIMFKTYRVNVLDGWFHRLTCQAVYYRRSLFLVLFLRSCTVLPIHFTDRRSAFALDLGVKLLIEQNLVHKVWLHWTGLCWWLWGAIIITCKKKTLHEVIIVTKFIKTFLLMEII